MQEEAAEKTKKTGFNSKSFIKGFQKYRRQLHRTRTARARVNKTDFTYVLEDVHPKRYLHENKSAE